MGEPPFWTLLQAAGEVETDLQRLLFSLITAKLVVEQEAREVRVAASSVQ